MCWAEVFKPNCIINLGVGLCRCYLLSTYHLKLKGKTLLLTSTFFRGDYFRIQILVFPQGSSVGDGIEIVLPVPPNLNVGAHPPPPISHSFTSPLPPSPLPSCEAPMMHIQISHQPTEGHVHFLFLLPWFSMPSSESHMGKSQKRKDSDCKTLISPQEETIKMTTRLEAHLHSIVPNSFMNRDKLYMYSSSSCFKKLWTTSSFVSWTYVIYTHVLFKYW